ncbi:Crp/Fnr family transcriptional regulator [Candidatus Sumerlaeota bacterium]|nr:Crp/Fnr family transcriptional regulator [Candidatus Sumerlaeota bacterium]
MPDSPTAEHTCDVCALRTGWLFARLGEEETALLASYARSLTFSRRQILFNEGDPAAQMFVICSGVVKLTRVSPEGRVQVLGLVTPGQMAGIEGFFHSHYDLGAESLTAGSACVLPREQLLRTLREHPAFALQLLEAMHLKLDEARAHIQEMGKTSAEAKICTLLCDLLPHLQQSGKASKGAEGFPLAHSDLAEILGLSRETISRAVGGLAKQGIVTLARNQVLIHDPERLKELAR